MLLGNKRDKRGTWTQAFVSLFFPVFVILFIRWGLIEPYVIPSGSMIPTLLKNDFILVNKATYGVRWPFTQSWIWRWQEPEIGDVVVFRYPQDPDIFYIKRVIGRPGDEIEYKSDGRVFVNGSVFAFNRVGESKSADLLRFVENKDLQIYREKESYYTLLDGQKDYREGYEDTVPGGHLFVMGDNRDFSSDSRVWGFVPMSHLIGKAEWIWLSCDKTQEGASFLCDWQTLRLERLFRGIL